MKNQKYPIGMRVIGIENDQYEGIVGLTGTIVDTEGDSYGIEFDNFIHGHSLGGGDRGVVLSGDKRRSGWWCNEKEIIPLVDNKDILKIKKEFLKWNTKLGK